MVIYKPKPQDRKSKFCKFEIISLLSRKQFFKEQTKRWLKDRSEYLLYPKWLTWALSTKTIWEGSGARNLCLHESIDVKRSAHKLRNNPSVDGGKIEQRTSCCEQSTSKLISKLLFAQQKLNDFNYFYDGAHKAARFYGCSSSTLNGTQEIEQKGVDEISLHLTMFTAFNPFHGKRESERRWW